MSERKSQLRAAALDYLLENGLANASLRPIASKLGTSARILMFHFRSKEGLLQEAMEELHHRLQESFTALAESRSSRRAPLKLFWEWATQPKNASYLRLMYEAQLVALQNPTEYGRYLKNSSDTWQTLTLRVLSESLRSRRMAVLCIAVFDGLMLEFLSTNDLRGTTAALDHFIRLARSRQTP